MILKKTHNKSTGVNRCLGLCGCYAILIDHFPLGRVGGTIALML